MMINNNRNNVIEISCAQRRPVQINIQYSCNRENIQEMWSICSTLASAWAWSASFGCGRDFVRIFLLYLLSSILIDIVGRGKMGEASVFSFTFPFYFLGHSTLHIHLHNFRNWNTVLNRANRLIRLLLEMIEKFHLIDRILCNISWMKQKEIDVKCIKLKSLLNGKLIEASIHFEFAAKRAWKSNGVANEAKRKYAIWKKKCRLIGLAAMKSVWNKLLIS